ncbi:thiamine phosphate synthase [Helicobacter sp. 11S03491-1]|uniref:thiamine phosphate synthase n=1 Tax=Helicobacter sp. 11S03491-1 TaxID=1476196 RepID=UPI0015DA0D6F|nr:thiamine phosphate synthase [Helicobacter sp. 11S03491-1]
MFESYFITSPLLYPQNSVEIFYHHLRNISLHHSIDKACFRDNVNIIPIDLIKVFAQWCQSHHIKSFLNLSNTSLSLKIANQCNIDGIHIKSNQLHTIKIAISEKKSIFYSAHQSNEILQALDLGAHFVTISPIFPTPNKPKPLGIDYCSHLNSHIKPHLFALGGIITEEQINAIKSFHLRGFGSIRYFLPHNLVF